jgi:hypothetical protein
MFCPQCRAEYRQGFTHCSDCEIDLVDQLPVPQPPPESFEIVHSTESLSDCVFSCKQLQAAGIPYKVSQERHQSVGKSLDEHYDIVVAAEFASRAKAELTKEQWDFQDEEEQQRLIGFPEDDGGPTQDEPRDYKPWCPEDATVEIYSESADQVADRRAWMVEASLRENLIQSRTDDLEDGSRRVSVMPEDESRAREIVREILDGSPPP